MVETYTHYSREEWRDFYYSGERVSREIDNLDELVSLNDRLTQEDVQDIYRPLLHYIDLLYMLAHHAAKQKGAFFDRDTSKAPFVIGISGSVAVGKSTVARVLRELLDYTYPDQKVEMMTTDGFLYPNEELRRRGLMSRKGFPESYDMVALLEFMREIKLGETTVSYPEYSHSIYDIVPGQMNTIDQPDILIVEGINTFQLPQNQQIYVSDFFDFAIYVDAEPLNIKQWYIKRFLMHLTDAKDDPTSYFYEMAHWTPEEIENYGNEIWYTINMTNLVQHIEPTKDRADLIIHKGEGHVIDQISVRKY